MSGLEHILAVLASLDVDRILCSPCIDDYFLGSTDQVDGFRRIGADALLRHVIILSGM